MNITEKILSLSSDERVDKSVYPRRVYNLLKSKGYDPDSPKYIHITGSKGKGSLAFNCYNLLRNNGKRVGMFTSPHIFDIRERFAADGDLISESGLEALLGRYGDFLKSEKLHFFEVCLFLAMVYFLEEGLEYIVLEVGVGGRFDPTNFCRPEIALIAHISLEHRNFLGDTLEEIAYDKAGIIKDCALSIDQDEIVREILKKEGSVEFHSEIIEITNHKTIKDSQIFDLRIRGRIFKNVKLNKIGKAHLLNYTLALAGVLDICGDISNIEVSAPVPYRMEMIRDDLIIDTSHNGASFENFLSSLEELGWRGVVLYLTILEGKELEDIARTLIKHKDIIKRIEFYELKNTNAKGLYELVKDFIPSEYKSDISGLRLDEGEKKAFSGSFYSIAEIKRLLRPN